MWLMKLFHSTDVVGQTLTLNTTKLLKITGVMKNMPANTHLSFDILQSYSTLLKENPPRDGYNLDNAWYNDGCTTYLLLKARR
jgi:putative ABC transport system permease protein